MSADKVLSLGGVVALVSNTEGRDKFMKLHQYLARVGKTVFADNKELANKLDIIFSS